jgi:TetR/AcrR family transcriptional repressor of nem operon
VRVSRAQANENRRTVINVASRLFRERGFDGVGLNDLMKGAGLTHGGFYKQFQSKEDLAIQASAKALENSAVKWSGVIAKAARRPLAALVRSYLSDRHRKQTAEGCAFAALGSDAARRSAALRDAFETGIEAHLDVLDALVKPSPGENTRDKSIATLSTMVGALILSRAVNDERLSKRFLRAAARGVLTESPMPMP